MKLKLTYINGEIRHITNDLNKEQLKSLYQNVSDGYLFGNPNFPFDY